MMESDLVIMGLELSRADKIVTLYSCKEGKGGKEGRRRGGEKQES